MYVAKTVPVCSKNGTYPRIRVLKYTLLNPEDGVIVKTNQNTLFRKQLEGNQKEFDNKMLEIESMKRWKDGVNKALWVVFGILATIIINMIFMHKSI